MKKLAALSLIVFIASLVLMIVVSMATAADDPEWAGAVPCLTKPCAPAACTPTPIDIYDPEE